MAGIDDNVAVLGDWPPPLNPSPRTFFSSLVSDDFTSRPFLGPMLENGGSKGPLPGSEQQKMSMNSEQEEIEFGSGASRDQLSEPSVFSGQRLSSRGSLSERMAARAGFNAPRLNTARIRSSNISSSSALEVRSPYLTIPPGLSPTTLLDSPVFLSNSLAQPSPTTGKIPLAPCNNRSSMTVSAAADKNKEHPLEDIDTASFVFKPHTESSSSYVPNAANRELSSSYFPNVVNKADSAIDHQQSFPGIGTPLQSEHTIHTQKEVTEVYLQNQPEFHPPSDFSKSTIQKDSAGNIMSTLTRSCTVAGTADHSPPPDDQEEGEGDQRESACMVGGGPSEDGYNWRKYGQKQVKGSEYPRSYYKCTHPNCPVKKKVERSHEGHITEIIYKGKHNHPKPPPNRRSAIGSSHPSSDMDVTEQHGARTTFDGETVWGSMQGGTALAGSDWRHDGVEAGTSASVVTEFHDPSTSMRVQNGLQMDAVDVSSTLSNDDDEDDGGTHGSVSLGHDDEGDESESKRRKADASLMELSGATRAFREPRVVVQTTSEVDILDDGYRWRKYGQKVVKGNPNPRSYYKCTSAGCNVRKHVERASHDLKSVITTYEGKHNHDVPAARNSSHVNSGLSSVGPAPAAQPQIHRPESSQAHDSMPRFDSPTSLSTFGMPGRPPLGSAVGFSFGMNSPGLANLAMAGLGPAQGRMPLLPHLHSYLGQQRNVNEVGFMMPKGEPKEEPILDSNLPIATGSGYHQVMSGLPLGRQL